MKYLISPLVYCVLPLVALSSAASGLVACQTRIQETVELHSGPSDPPELLRIVEQFEREPTANNLRHALDLLDKKLADWGSVSDRVVCDILNVIEREELTAAQDHILPFVATDNRLDVADLIATCAALTLAALRGPGAYEALSLMVRSEASSRVASAALALGKLGDMRAVPILNQLATRKDPETRGAVLSALSAFCDPTSETFVLAAIADEDAGVRAGGAWWLATCASTSNEDALSLLLDDPASSVRAIALKGLIRLRSSAGCGKLPQLLPDESLTVQGLAKDYSMVCEAQ